MRKIAWLLAAVLLLGCLAACGKETYFVVDYYCVNIPQEKGWSQLKDGTQVKNWEIMDTHYDLWLQKGKALMQLRVYNPDDLIDFPGAQGLFEYELETFGYDYPEAKAVGEAKTVEKNGNTVYYQLMEDGTRQSLCCMVDFNRDTGTVAWAIFTAHKADMKNLKSEFLDLLANTTCSFVPEETTVDG